MSRCEYNVAPMADLHGNAGNLGPGDREQYYQPFVEKVRLHCAPKAEGEND
ncbi:hypothetical protein LJC42_07050 [Eubacteriales bacterium OttesenSCG-928-K08]|nr:hypothetical protein [Eubacteriales bacterium OttesenSCG-928-K08]